MEHYQFKMTGHLELMDGSWYLVPTSFDAPDDGSGLDVPRDVVEQAMEPRRLEVRHLVVPRD